ncbi:hypothetical protein COCMIDRAFT_72223, partial [Bipolaris oryzae ATCC 44560]
FSALGLANKNQPAVWLHAISAIVIIIHLETDDVVQQNKDVADIIVAIAKSVNAMRTWSPNTKIVV